MSRLDLLKSDTKRVLLQLMKRQGEVSLDDAIAATGLARATLREHLTVLGHDGLVMHRAHRQGRGRPSLRYRLSEEGEQLFPARDGVLLRELLGFLERGGHAPLLEAFFVQFWEVRREEAEQRLSSLEADDLEGRLQVLEQLLREQGFMPDVCATEEEVVIRECNCPFPETIKKTRLPCRLEAQFFEQVLRQETRRVSYIPEGNAACTYALPRTGRDNHLETEAPTRQEA